MRSAKAKHGARLLWLEGSSQLLRASRIVEDPATGRALVLPGVCVQWRATPAGYRLERADGTPLAGGTYLTVPDRAAAQTFGHEHGLTAEWRARKWW